MGIPQNTRVHPSRLRRAGSVFDPGMRLTRFRPASQHQSRFYAQVKECIWRNLMAKLRRPQ
jgi:hypothetical protein